MIGICQRGKEAGQVVTLALGQVRIVVLEWELRQEVTIMTRGPKPDCTIDSHAEEPATPNHPDQHALIDWGIFGPKDPRIEQLVWKLAYGHGLRLTEIEASIVEALEGILHRSEATLHPKGEGTTEL